MGLLFIALTTYVVCGLVYGAVAVSRFKTRRRWSEDEATVNAAVLMLLLSSIVFWPLYLYSDVKDA